jgi:hypothetical protein
MAERDVIYRLKTIYDEGGAQAFALMTKEHAAAIKSMEDRWKSFTETMKTGAGSAGDSVGNSYKKQKDHAREFYDYVGAENKKLVDAIKERERAESAAMRANERAMAQVKAGNAQMREGFLNTAEGVTRVARGLSLMGFVSDENLQKLLKTLAVVQGTSDIILGSVKAYTALQKAVDGYTLAVNAARTAEAARAGVAAGGAAAGAGSGVAGAAGGLGLGSLVSGGAAAAAAIAALTFVIVELAETATGTALDLDSFTSGVGRASERFSKSVNDWINDTIGGDFSGKIKTNTPFLDLQREAASAQLRERLAGNQQQYDRERPFAVESARRGGFDRMLGLGGAGGASQAGMIGDEIARMTRQAGVFGEKAEGNFGTGRAFYLDKAVEAHERIADLTQKRAAEESRIRQSSMEYHQSAINAAQAELGLLRQQQEAVASRYESARERFGAMNPAEQSRLRRLGEVVNQANELRGAGRTDEARNIEKRLTPNDLNALGSMRGLEGVDNFLGRVHGDRADARGFGVYGKEERKRLEEIAPRIERLVAETTLNVEMKYKVEIDDAKAKEQLRRELEPIVSKINTLFIELTGLKQDVTKSQRDQAARDAFTRRSG